MVNYNSTCRPIQQYITSKVWSYQAHVLWPGQTLHILNSRSLPGDQPLPDKCVQYTENIIKK